MQVSRSLDISLKIQACSDVINPYKRSPCYCHVADLIKPYPLYVLLLYDVAYLTPPQSKRVI